MESYGIISMSFLDKIPEMPSTKVSTWDLL